MINEDNNCKAPTIAPAEKLIVDLRSVSDNATEIEARLARIVSSIDSSELPRSLKDDICPDIKEVLLKVKEGFFPKAQEVISDIEGTQSRIFSLVGVLLKMF